MAYTVTLSNGQRIRLNIATGDVIDSSQAHRTSIQQAAPTVVSDGRTTTVVPGRISSRTDVESELWLRLPDGSERACKFQNVQVPVRPGHRMSVLWGAPVGHENGPYFGTRNHATGTSNVDLAGAIKAGSPNWGLKAGGGAAYLGMVVACMLIGALVTFVKTDSADRAGYAVVGALLGLGAAVLLTPLWYALVFTPRVKRLINEVEQYARERLAERDTLDFVPTEKNADDQLPAADGSALPGLAWGAAVALVAVLAYVGWHAFGDSTPDNRAKNLPPAVANAQRIGNTQGNHQSPGSTDWAGFNARQLRRHAELLARAPSQGDLDGISEMLRPASIPLAALYTLFPKGHEKPFPAVLELLHSKGVVQPGTPPTAGQVENILKDLDATSSHVKPASPDDLARAIESGKSVFVPNGGSLLRLTAVQRDADGHLTGFMVYDPAGQVTSPSPPSALTSLLSTEGALVSIGKAVY